MTPERASPRARDTWIVLAAALLARLAVVAWAASRFPPTADGTFYHRIAERVAAGLGYTWLWPDGVVTYAAHYPVGYPALIGGAYAIFGAHPGVAMATNALLGALAAVAVHRLAARAFPPGPALVAGLLAALHPGLVAYTPALMSEGVTASLVACAAWASAWVRDAVLLGARRTIAARIVLLGIVVGLATLVRPQSLVFAPLFALIAVAPLTGPRARRTTLGFAALATVSALAVCAPWTIRNCERMNRCALVSVNGGWNLLIGADPASTGAWSPIKVPDACREVWDEAGKDACFGRAATRYIAEHPGAWLSLVPRKLAATFDYCGAAGWYLHESNSAACGDRCKLGLGVAETLYERGVLALSLIGLARAATGSRARRFATWAVVALGLVFLFLVHAWVAYAALVVAALFGGRSLLRGPVLPAASVAVLGATLLTHAVFFGAGRYGLVTFPLIAGMAGVVFAGLRTRA
ncbi:glycosyltransferase family 39 protein [Polyangium sp. 6x1]|uniref:glycosyltransferase family 39 protein n=1 Tax=Polyangium sp. 6x1 TaxID=3042689 RepID=UPI002482F03C|nr:glycosyltransferase family 39 protein [Polyangium sp. 6x1]MDI1449606.1 glycosyltransferase family 39 protein [Polyangium sp. 6x1]